MILQGFAQFRQHHGDDPYRLRVRDASVPLPENNPPSGRPVIRGAPFLGEKLTVDVSGISDADGMTNVAFEYEWYRSNFRLRNYVGSGYLPEASDIPHGITVRVTFLDDAGFEESLTSEAVGVSNATLTAEFRNVPTTHNGQDALNLRVAFTSDIDATAEELRNHSFTVTGGAVTRVRQVESRNDLWEITIQPAGQDPVIVDLPPLRACNVPGAICTVQRLRLTGDNKITIPGPLGLTAEFRRVPESHNGQDAFTVRVFFNQDIDVGWEDFRDYSFTVTGGSVTSSRRIDSRDDLWEITIGPASNDPVTVVLPAQRGCEDRGAICTSSSLQLQLPIETSIPGPVPASAHQAEAENSPATGKPEVTGTAEVGESLTATTSDIADPDGLTNAAFSYQWSRDDGSTTTDISGATASTYTLQEEDLDLQVSVTVSFTDDERQRRNPHQRRGPRPAADPTERGLRQRDAARPARRFQRLHLRTLFQRGTGPGL